MAAPISTAGASASSMQSDEDRYFSTNPPPKDLGQHMALVEEFVDKHAKANRRVVLVTSGGTTVRETNHMSDGDSQKLTLLHACLGSS